MSSLHVDLLLALNAAKPHGLPAGALLADMRQLRHRGVTLPQIETALRDLADKSFTAPLEGALTGRWRITALGASALSEEGLA